MLQSFLTLFLAGSLTILLPCILPLVPVVLGVSISTRHRLRPLATVMGMVLSFVLFTFALQVLLSRFVEAADLIRIGTYDVLLLFGVGFVFHAFPPQVLGAIGGSLFFVDKGWGTVGIVLVLNLLALFFGGRIANRIQQTGGELQSEAQARLGVRHELLTAFAIGMTLGLVWVPCAGPALGFALAVVRDQPGVRALALLLAYALGAGVPLLIVGYGGQTAVRVVHSLNRYTGLVKLCAGVLLILTAITLRFNGFTTVQVWLADHTPYGTIGTDLENALFSQGSPASSFSESPSSHSSMTPSNLPRIIRAPAFAGLGPWHNSPPLTLEQLRGKVVLVDFWTYSCINCIRTLPYIQGYWEKYKDQPFVLVGIHTPEFVFEKSESNVADAIKRHGLTYPIAQDNAYGTWSAFANRYWPAKYLIDAEGYVRYVHFGEGNYDETDKAIMSLLGEIGSHPQAQEIREPSQARRGAVSPETYLGERSWSSLANAQGEPATETISYDIPSSLALHTYALGGAWQLVDGERQVLRSPQGEIRMKWQGGEINLVLGLENEAKPVMADVEIDGKQVKSFTVDRHDLFNLFTGPYGEHELVLRLRGNGVEGYAFTFGG